jgi:hypothetical protein
MIRVEAKSSARKRIKGLIVALVVVGGVALIPASSATAHVHGITPLSCLPGVPENAGANQTDNTPADDEVAVSSPLVVNSPGRSPLGPGDGGSGRTPFCDF